MNFVTEWTLNVVVERISPNNIGFRGSFHRRMIFTNRSNYIRPDADDKVLGSK